MKFTISELNAWMRCPQYSYYQHRLMRGTPKTKALRLGDMFHQNMACQLEGRPLEFLLHDSPDKEWPYLMHVVSNWETPSDWQVIGVEKALQHLIAPDLTLMGRLDCLIIRRGKVWSVQWKTLAKGKNLAHHQESVRLSNHEIAYQMLVMNNRETLGIENIPFGGTILGTAVKQLKAAGNDYKMDMMYLPRTMAEQNMGEYNITLAAKQMANMEVYRNHNECFTMWGPCQYYDVCHAGIDLSGPPYIDLENRYKDL